MKVCSAILAVYLLSADNLGCDAVSVLVFFFTFARVDEPGMDSKEFEVCSFVCLVVLEAFKQW